MLYSFSAPLTEKMCQPSCERMASSSMSFLTILFELSDSPSVQRMVFLSLASAGCSVKTTANCISSPCH